MSTKLAHQTQKAAGIGNGMRTATVAAITSSGITISVAGGSFTAGVGVVTSYAPAVGDTVAVFRQDSSWLILGRVAPASTRGIASLGSDSGPYGSETVIASTPVETWKADTAYVATVRGRWKPTNTTTPRSLWHVRKGTSVSGQTIVDFGRVTCISVEPYNVTLSGYFTVGSADITTAVCLTITSGSAAGVNDVTAMTPTVLEILPAGPASLFPDNTVMA